MKEIKEGHPHIVDKGDVEGGPQPPAGTSELDALIQRVSGLEQAVSELTKESQEVVSAFDRRTLSSGNCAPPEARRRGA